MVGIATNFTSLVPRPPPFYTGLSLSCIIVDVNRGDLGTRQTQNKLVTPGSFIAHLAYNCQLSIKPVRISSHKEAILTNEL